jgi:hypothetical protein
MCGGEAAIVQPANFIDPGYFHSAVLTHLEPGAIYECVRETETERQTEKRDRETAHNNEHDNKPQQRRQVHPTANNNSSNGNTANSKPPPNNKPQLKRYFVTQSGAVNVNSSTYAVRAAPASEDAVAFLMWADMGANQCVAALLRWPALRLQVIIV